MLASGARNSRRPVEKNPASANETTARAYRDHDARLGTKPRPAKRSCHARPMLPLIVWQDRRDVPSARRADAVEYMPHVRETRPQTVYADIAATRAHLERQTGARRIFVLGFCFGGRLAFLQSAELSGVAGVIGFYGRLGKRENETWPTPAEEAKRMRAPVLGLFGGDDPSIPPADVAAFDRALSETNVRHHLETYPGAPHSFFDRTF